MDRAVNLRVVTLSDPGSPIAPEMLSHEVRGTGDISREAWVNDGGPLKERIDRIERRLIQEALAQNGGNQTRTAEHLGLTRQGLVKKMQRHGVKSR